jgi:hypothetical protein
VRFWLFVLRRFDFLGISFQTPDNVFAIKNMLSEQMCAARGFSIPKEMG